MFEEDIIRDSMTLCLSATGTTGRIRNVMSEQIILSNAIKMGILGSPRLKVVGMRKRAGEMSEQAEKQLTLHDGKAVLTAEMPSVVALAMTELAVLKKEVTSIL
jgi:hypothetical protein